MNSEHNLLFANRFHNGADSSFYVGDSARWFVATELKTILTYAHHDIPFIELVNFKLEVNTSHGEELYAALASMCHRGNPWDQIGVLRNPGKPQVSIGVDDISLFHKHQFPWFLVRDDDPLQRVTVTLTNREVPLVMEQHILPTSTATTFMHDNHALYNDVYHSETFLSSDVSKLSVSFDRVGADLVFEIADLTSTNKEG